MYAEVVSLWSLLEACRAGGNEDQHKAAERAAAALRARPDPEPLRLEVRAETLVVDGQRAVGGADSFAAVQGLMTILRDAGVERAELANDAPADSLRRWGHHLAAGELPPIWPAGVAVQPRLEPLPADVVRPATPAPTPEGPESRLRSVFLQHRLIAGLPAIPGVDPATAKLVIQAVVDRLLSVDGGLEPLMLLQQDEGLLRRSTAVAVLTVVLARRAGWPIEQLADLGVAGLLHDLGAVVDRAAPDEAAFRWLLDRGDEDLWLRSALCARRWREVAAITVAASDPLAVVSIVRLAVAAHEGGAAGIDAIARRGAVPAELAEVGKGALFAAP